MTKRIPYHCYSFVGFASSNGFLIHSYEVVYKNLFMSPDLIHIHILLVEIISQWFLGHSSRIFSILLMDLYKIICSQAEID